MKQLNKIAWLLAVCCSAVLAGCTSEPEATRALTGAGYTNIKMTGYRFLLCDEKDSWSTGFEATGPNGNRVSGAVCSGVLKGATIRLD